MKIVYDCAKSSISTRFSTHFIFIVQFERRLKVVKLMIAIVTTFLCLSEPFHLRKLLQHFYPHYDVAFDLANLYAGFDAVSLSQLSRQPNAHSLFQHQNSPFYAGCRKTVS